MLSFLRNNRKSNFGKSQERKMEKKERFSGSNQINLKALAEELEKLNRAIKNCPEGYVCPFLAGDYDEETLKEMGFDPQKTGCPGCDVLEKKS
jgi:hypothetical protein